MNGIAIVLVYLWDTACIEYFVMYIVKKKKHSNVIRYLHAEEMYSSIL